MNCKIVESAKSGTVKAIPSKSVAHRLIIAAVLSGENADGYCESLSVDITATKECMDAMVSSSSIRKMRCRESGSTLRFLVPVAAALGGRSEFYAEGRLPNRPMAKLKEQLELHGCKMSEDGSNPIWVEGKLEAGVYTLPGDISSQYVTGLLMALPLCNGESEIKIEGKLQSRPYVDVTLDVLAKAKIEIIETESGFRVPGNQNYNLPIKYLENVEGDWSNGAFWLVMDALLNKNKKGNIKCEGLDEDSKQGDRQIEDWIHMINSTDKVDIDVSDIPDLVPILSVLASSRKRGTITNIVNAGRLRLKESDRLKAVTEELNKLGANIIEGEDYLEIEGVETLHGGTVNSHNDHRIVMMAASAACIADGDIEIDGCEAVNKSYPHFFKDYEMLGGKIQWI